MMMTRGGFFGPRRRCRGSILLLDGSDCFQRRDAAGTDHRVFPGVAACEHGRSLAHVECLGKLAAMCIEHHRTHKQLAHFVRHDSLTGLPNRICLEDRTQNALALAQHSGASRGGLMVLDFIDRF